MAVLGLCCCPGFSLAVLSAWASHCAGSSCHRAQAPVLRHQAFQHASCSCPAARGILPDQGTHPLPALAGRVFTTEPPAKPLHLLSVPLPFFPSAGFSWPSSGETQPSTCWQFYFLGILIFLFSKTTILHPFLSSNLPSLIFSKTQKCH